MIAQAATDRHAQAQRLRAIRGQLDAIEAREWMLAADGEGLGVVSRGADGSLVEILAFDGRATPDEMQFVADAPGNVRFLLDLVDRAIAHASRAASAAAQPGAEPALGLAQGQTRGAGRATTPGARSRANLAAETAMKCGEAGFRQFLVERHGLEPPPTAERAAQRLRSLLGITSRRQLNDDETAAAAWRRLRADFEAWRREGR